MYPHQLERLTAALAAHRLDALVGTTPANIAYLTDLSSGARAVDPKTPVLAIFAPSGSALVLPARDAMAIAAAGATADHVVPYAETPGPALASALEALGVRRGAIGIDAGALAPAGARRLGAALADHTIRDGAPALLEARQVKSPWEIEALERALIAAEEALNAVIQMLEPGVTARAAIELLESEVRRRDATPRSTVIVFGPRTAGARAPGSERALGAGDLIRLDAACVWRGFHAEVARTAVMGAPDARQEAAFDAALNGIEAALAGVRSGAIANQVFSKAVNALPVAGRTDDAARDVGHGIGLDARETPILDAESATALETGMVLRLEARHDEAGRHGVQIKETVLVTPAGPRVMNRSRRGLVVLD